MNGGADGRRPWWFVALTVVLMLPVLATPTLMAMCPSGLMARMLVRFYPFYVLGSGWMAWLSWPERPWLSWILLALLVLDNAAIWMLLR